MARIIGTSGDDVLRGTSGRDVIKGRGGDAQRMTLRDFQA
jgi:Ca2+-binding RTX toxin-like protein